MRRIDKRLNIQKANLLTEQRYMEDKSGVMEGPTIDIAGITDALADMYKSAAQGAQSVDDIDGQVYKLMNKALSGSGDVDTKKNIYLTLANKVERLSQEVQDPNIQAELEAKAKSWRVMSQQADSAESGDLGGMFKGLGQQGMQ